MKKNACSLNDFPKHLVEEAMNELIRQRIKHAFESEKIQNKIDEMLEATLLSCIEKDGKRVMLKTFNKTKKSLIEDCIDEFIENGYSDKIREKMDDIAEQAVLDRLKKL